jgi:hypothetical protein
MRQELDAMFDGIYPEIPKAQTHILRKMRRQSTTPLATDELRKKYRGIKQVKDFFVPGEGYLIPCDCVDSITREPDVDHFCPICFGEGWIWDEYEVDTYRINLKSDVGKSLKESLIAAGLTNIPLMIFYVRSSELITRADKMIEIWTDTEGEALRPYRRKSLYRIGTPIDFRSDGGKLEYWKLDCFEEQRKFLNGPEG